MKMKQVMAGLAIGLLLTLTAPSVLRAERLLTEEEALKEMFPDAQKVEKVSHTLTESELGRIKARIKTMVLHQEGSQSKNVDEVINYDFYFGYKDNKKTGVAVFEKQPGKWGPVSFILVLDPDTAKLTNMAVTAYVEKRGRPIALRSYLSQYFGKGSSDPIQVGTDIRAVSGATISSRCTDFVVRKVITLYEEVFLNVPLIDRLQETEYYATRAKALDELNKLGKSEQDKLVEQLISALSQKETGECQQRAIISTLTAFGNPATLAKFQSIKFPADTAFNSNLEHFLTKASETAGIKLVWSNDNLKTAAGQIKITEAIKPSKTDSFWTVLELVLTRYGCSKSRNLKDDAFPRYAYSIEGDTLKVIDIETGQKQWQEWWKNYSQNGTKEQTNLTDTNNKEASK